MTTDNKHLLLKTYILFSGHSIAGEPMQVDEVALNRKPSKNAWDAFYQQYKNSTDVMEQAM